MLSSNQHLSNVKNFFFKPSLKKIDFAILSAMTEELEYLHLAFTQSKYETITIFNFEFKVYEYNNHKILLAATGIGTTFAASIVTLIHQQFSPEYILFLGTAGAIQSELKIRDVIIIEQCFEAEIQGIFDTLQDTPFESCLTHPLNNQKFPRIYSAHHELVNIANNIHLPNIKIRTGTGVSSNTFPAPKELFEKIKIHHPLAIDMETSACYQIAWLLQTKVLAIRGISNLLNADGSDDDVNQSDIKGSVEAATKVILTIIDTVILKMNPNPLLEAATYINQLGLQPHPEGGYYASTFQSTDIVKSIDENKYDNEPRKAGSAIFYLLKENDFSAWHRLKSDEIWHYYKGSIIKIYVIDPEGNLSIFYLGNPLEQANASFQVFIRAGYYFAAEVVDKCAYTLVGCTVSPGFDFRDFQLMERKEFIQTFPQHQELITQFTRIHENLDRARERAAVTCKM